MAAYKWVILASVAIIILVIFGYVGEFTDTLYNAIVANATANTTASYVSSNGTAISAMNDYESMFMGNIWWLAIGIFMVIIIIVTIRSNKDEGDYQ